MELENTGWKNWGRNNRKHLYCLEETVSRNMDVNDSTSEDSEEARTLVEKTFTILENT